MGLWASPEDVNLWALSVLCLKPQGWLRASKEVLKISVRTNSLQTSEMFARMLNGEAEGQRGRPGSCRDPGIRHGSPVTGQRQPLPHHSGSGTVHVTS